MLQATEDRIKGVIEHCKTYEVFKDKTKMDNWKTQERQRWTDSRHPPFSAGPWCPALVDLVVDSPKTTEY